MPRTWTPAYGVMSGQSFPGELLPAYDERRGPGRLRDAEGPEPREERVIRRTRAYVAKGIAVLKARTENVWRWE